MINFTAMMQISEAKPAHYVQMILEITRMWANAQRDGRPAEYR